MKRKFSLLLMFALSACVTGNIDKTPPKQISNACAIFDEKAKWEKSIFNSASEWGVTPGTILAFMRQESGFKHDAKPVDKSGNRLSSATGFSQALDGTWKTYERERGEGRREKFKDSADFIGWYLNKLSKQTGIAKSDTRDLYLAFHEGGGGYNRGTYANKTWLLSVADKVATNAHNYDDQLFGCEKRKMRKFEELAAN